MDIPDLNDVRTFVAIGREGTLTAAARELNLPTSTVSRALTRLEKHLEVLLVQRSPRGLVLTDFGKEYLQTCRRALRTLQDGSELRMTNEVEATVISDGNKAQSVSNILCITLVDDNNQRRSSSDDGSMKQQSR